MSRTTVMAVTCVLLVVTAGLVWAQQAGQSGQQSGQQSAYPRSTIGAGGQGMQMMDSSHAQRLAQAAQQQNVNLQRAVQAAEQQSRGRAIGVALVQSQGQTGSQSGQTGQTAQPGQGAGGQAGQQNITAQVFIATQSQLQVVTVDPQSNRVQGTETRQMIANPWRSQAGMGGSTGSTSGSGTSGSISGGTSGSGASGSISGGGASGSVTGGGAGGSTGTGSTGQSMQDQDSMQQGRTGAMAARARMLTTSQAQQLYQTIEQQNVSLSRVLQTTQQQAQQGQVIGAFLVLHQGGTMGGQTGGQQQQQQRQQQQQQNVIAHVYVVQDSQIREMMINAQNNQTVGTETRQMLTNPWSQTGTGDSMQQRMQERVQERMQERQQQRQQQQSGSGGMQD